MVPSSISEFWGQGCYLFKTLSLTISLPLTHTYTHSRPLSCQISPIQSHCWDWQDWQIAIRALCALIKLLSDFREHLNMNVCCPAPIRHFLISAVSTSSSLCSVDGIIVTLMKNQWLCVCIWSFWFACVCAFLLPMKQMLMTQPLQWWYFCDLIDRFTYEIAPVFVLMEQLTLKKMREMIGWPDGEGDGLFSPG